MRTILIVHSCPLLREGMCAVLSSQGVEVVTCPQEALALIKSTHPQVMVLDDGLCDSDPFQLTREVVEIGGTQVFVLARVVNEERLFRYLQHGAAAYESPTLSCGELIAKIDRVATGEYLISSEVLRRVGCVRQRPQPVTKTSPPEPVPLSAREREMLREIVKGGTTKEIAHRLGLSHQTIKNHLSSVFKKLCVQDRTAAVALALHKQWITFEECDSACGKATRGGRTDLRPHASQSPAVVFPGSRRVARPALS